MSLLALLTAQGGTVPPSPVEPTPPPGVSAEPLRRLTLAQTVDAPPVPRTVTVAGLTAPALVTGRAVPTTDLTLLGTTSTMDRAFTQEAHSWEFTTDAGEVAFRVRKTGANMPALALFVDGAPVSAAPYTRVSADSQVRVALGTAGTWRTVRVDLSALLLNGIDVPAGARVQATAPRKKLYIYGDSWIEGTSYRPKTDGTTGNENGPGFEHLAFLTARLLNAAPIIGGIGGTGYVAGSTRTPPYHYASQARLDRLMSHRPDIVLVFGSINDGGSDCGPAAQAVYERIAADLPGVPVLVCGTQDWGQTSGPTPGNQTILNAAKAAPNVEGTVDPLAEDWVPAGDSTINNTAYNNAHLTVKGNRYYAEKVAAFIARSLNIPSA